MKTGLKKTQKITEIYFDEASPIITVSTYNTNVKGKISDECFEVLTRDYELEQHELEQKLPEMEKQFKEHYLNKRKNGIA